jgi:hypothetical protein
MQTDWTIELDIWDAVDILSDLFDSGVEIGLSILDVFFNMTPLGENTLGNTVWLMLAMTFGLMIGYKRILRQMGWNR